MRTMKDSGVEWIDRIPADWEVQNLKNFFSFGKGLPITKENLRESGVPVISYGQIHGKYNPGTRLINELFRYVDAEYLTSNPSALVHQGDFIFADTSEDVDGCGNCCYVDKEMQLFAGYHTVVLSAANRQDNSYLAYLFRTDAWRSQIRRELVEVKVYSISRKVLRKTTILLPPTAEQQRIAAYLDEQCGEIDKVLAKTRESIEEYKKLKLSVITEAVTKGIRSDRPMKPSGNIWFEVIPETWGLKKVKYLFKIKKDIAGKEGFTVLSITQRGVKPKDLTKNEGQLAENYSKYQIVCPGDFAMNHMDLLTGWIDISKFHGVTSPDYRVFTLIDSEKQNPHYFLYMMQMCYSNRIFYGLGQGVSGMGRWRLQPDKFLNFTIPVPSLDEQQEIVAYLDQQCAEIDRLIAKKEQIITELESYKKSLIYECVTGKLEVE